MAETKQVKTKIKKKHWAQIIAPKVFDHMVLGETTVADKDEMLRKSISINLMVITDDPRKQALNVRFDVKDVKDGKAHTQLVGMDMTPSAVKRLIRRGRNKIDDSIVVRIGGGRLVRVKPVLVTNTKASKAAQTEIRLAVRKRLRELYTKMRFDDIVKDIIDMKTQRMLKDLCMKVHPIRSADIREITIVPQDRKMTSEMEALMEKETSEEDTRRQQMASAAAAASVGDETPTPPAKGARKPRKREPAPQELEDAGKSDMTEGPDDMGV